MVGRRESFQVCLAIRGTSAKDCGKSGRKSAADVMVSPAASNSKWEARLESGSNTFVFN
jgi:hypothetical protein